MKAIYAGTFDPFTMGHFDIAERALKVFGNVTVAVAADTGKQTLPLDRRVCIADIAVSGLKGVDAEPFYGLLSDYVRSKGDCVLIRGLRNAGDLEYELCNTRIYRSQCGVESVCIISDCLYEHISSTAVRQLASLGADLKGFVVSGTESIISELYGKSVK